MYASMSSHRLRLSYAGTMFVLRQAGRGAVAASPWGASSGGNGTGHSDGAARGAFDGGGSHLHGGIDPSGGGVASVQSPAADPDRPHPNGKWENGTGDYDAAALTPEEQSRQVEAAVERAQRAKGESSEDLQWREAGLWRQHSHHHHHPHQPEPAEERVQQQRRQQHQSEGAEGWDNNARHPDTPAAEEGMTEHHHRHPDAAADWTALQQPDAAAAGEGEWGELGAGWGDGDHPHWGASAEAEGWGGTSLQPALDPRQPPLDPRHHPQVGDSLAP